MLVADRLFLAHRHTFCLLHGAEVGVPRRHHFVNSPCRITKKVPHRNEVRLREALQAWCAFMPKF